MWKDSLMKSWIEIEKYSMDDCNWSVRIMANKTEWWRNMLGKYSKWINQNYMKIGLMLGIFIG